MDKETMELTKKYMDSAPVRKVEVAKTMNQYIQKLESLQPHVVQFLSSDDIPAVSSKQVSDLYVELQDRFEEFEKQAQANATRPVLSDKSIIPPRISAMESTQLNTNIQQLRSQLKQIQVVVNQTNDIAEPTFEEREADQQLKDISMMTVQTVKSNTEVQQKQLTAELASIRRQLQEIIEENQILREQNQKLTQEIDVMQVENQQNAHYARRLFEEREVSKEDFELLSSERERYRAKFENVKQLYEFESNRNAQFRQEQYSKLTQLEAEKEALVNNNEQLADRIKSLEACDMESAAIEVGRATKTITKLTEQIEELKKKLLEQKCKETGKIENLRATISALNEGAMTESKRSKIVYSGFDRNSNLNSLNLIKVGDEVPQKKEFNLADMLRKK
ncbi:Conserved_hypothetical protein [Hexamita inflata]|uniref:Uncharacterized protein n=1 Tax=Hexamita inflata TaxID=28002 RepID=A0ABP1HFE3_9EUKA